MRAQWLRFGVAIPLALAMLLAVPAFAQADQSDVSSDAVLHEPFAATSYVRIVRVLPNGKQQFMRNVRYPILLARDSAGRVRLDVVPNPPEECDDLKMPIPPVCSSWSIVIFDPRAQTTTRWEGGVRGFHGPVVFKLSPSQLEDAESSTRTMPKQPTANSLDDPSVTFESLGEKDIQGIRATGIRMTTVHWLDQAGARVRTVHIHEVWTSESMQLVVRIIDGDPDGEEMIAGLDHVSLGEHPDLFQLPDVYPTRFYDQSHLASDSLSLLTSWFVQMPDQGDSD